MSDIQVTQDVAFQIHNLSKLLKKKQEAKPRIPIESALNQFMEERRTNTKKTSSHYHYTFKVFFEHVDCRYIEEYGREVIDKFILRRLDDISINSMRSYVINLISFQNWLIKRGYKDKDEAFLYSDTLAPAKTRCIQECAKKIPRDQVLAFWNIVMMNRSFKDEYHLHLYRAVLGMYVFQGTRLNEPRGMQREDVDLTSRVIYLQPKDNKAKRKDKVFIHINYIPVLAKFLEIRDKQKTGSPHLFYFSSPDIPVSESTIERWFHKINKTLKRKYGFNKNVTSHLLRHCLGHYASMDGENPKRVQKILRHSSVRTTLDFYTHVDDDEIQEGVDKYNPFMSAKDKKYL